MNNNDDSRFYEEEKGLTIDFNDPLVQELLNEVREEKKKKEALENSKADNNIQNLNEIDIFQNFQRIPILKLRAEDKLNFFDFPDNEQLLNAISSIENDNILSPCIALDDGDGKYTVIIGRTRLIALRALYDVSKSDKYSTLPCFIIEKDKIDPLKLESMIISSNLSYRTISRKTFIRATLKMDEALRTGKSYRGQMNVVNVLSENLGVSKTTIHNNTCFKNLYPEALEMVENRIMKLGIGRMLSKLDHEKQKMIVETLGEDINDVEKVKALIEDRLYRRLDKDNKLVKETPETKIERVKSMVQSSLNLTITVPMRYVNDFLTLLVKYKRDTALSNPTAVCRAFFKLSYNERHMMQYVNRGLADQNVLDKLKAKKFDDVIAKIVR